jgi:membrane-associated phospholipid phosphatase
LKTEKLFAADPSVGPGTDQGIIFISLLMEIYMDTDQATREMNVKQNVPLVSFKLVLIAALFIICLFSFAFIAHEVVFEKEEIFDERINNFLAIYRTPGFISLMKVITFFGSSYFLLPAYLILLLILLFRRRWMTALNIAIIAISSTALMQILKLIFHRQRPALPLLHSIRTFSFPSGHALSSFIFSMVLISLVWKYLDNKIARWILTILLLVFSLSIGLSRIVLKMHYPTDVVAGYCLGICWVLLSFQVFRFLDRRRNHNQTEHR